MRRSHAATLARAALAAALLVPVVAAVPAAAKEGMQARLDAPIPMGEPGGTILAVGVRVEILDQDGLSPVWGSPIFIQLTGRSGAVTREYLTEERGEQGHYQGRIEVPAGGVRRVQVGMGGSSDIFAMLTTDPVTFGRATATTAQVAPPSPALTPWPRASAAPVGQAAVDPAGAADPGTAAGPAGTDPAAAPAPSVSAWAPAAVALAVVVLAAVLLLATRAGRRSSGAAGAAPVRRGADR